MAVRSAGVSCRVGQDLVTLALASLAVGLGAMVADKRLGVGLGQPAGILAASEPSRNHRPCPRFGFESTRSSAWVGGATLLRSLCLVHPRHVRNVFKDGLPAPWTANP